MTGFAHLFFFIRNIVLLLGGLLNGMSLNAACETATEFTWRTIETTHEKCADHRFGPKFECHLPWLGEKMEACRKTIANPVDLR